MLCIKALDAKTPHVFQHDKVLDDYDRNISHVLLDCSPGEIFCQSLLCGIMDV